MTPQEHYELAELLADSNGATEVRGMRGNLMARAQVHATLALAGFTRDAATGANHVHDVQLANGQVIQSRHGRPA